MTKNNASKPRAASSRFPVLGTVAGVLAAGAIAWVIVERFEAPAVLPSVTEVVAGASPLPKALDKPLWRDLSSAQQVALAPLEPEWDRMEGLRKRKWIEMSARFASMPPSEQQRVHERMRQWMKLTPQQRELARENYSRTSRLAQGDKAADWENYKQLSPEEKRKLARTPAAGHKSLPVALPESPMLVVPTPCPPNTTRRGAECILIGTDTPVPAATASVPGTSAPASPAASPAAPAPVPAPAGAAAPASASAPAPAGAGAAASAGGQSAAAQAANGSGN